MGRIELGGQVKFVNLSKLKKGQTIGKGKYWGSREGGNFNNVTHFLKPKDGATIGFSCTQMNKVVEREGIEKGMEIEVVYAGLGDKKIKGNFPHGVLVYMDEAELHANPNQVKVTRPAPAPVKDEAGDLVVDDEEDLTFDDLDLGELA